MKRGLQGEEKKKKVIDHVGVDVGVGVSLVWCSAFMHSVGVQHYARISAYKGKK